MEALNYSYFGINAEVPKQMLIIPNIGVMYLGF
jgi:hypothetical protein